MITLITKRSILNQVSSSRFTHEIRKLSNSSKSRLFVMTPLRGLFRLVTRRNLVKRVHSSRFFHAFEKLNNCPKSVFIALAPFNLFSLRSCECKPKSKEKLENFELKLIDACTRGEAAVSEFMDFTYTTIKDVSEAYIDCLKKEIDIIDEASKEGAASPKWTVLPEFEQLAEDLKKQWEAFLNTMNTFGKLMENEVLKMITKQENSLKVLAEKQKELEKMVSAQGQEINKRQQELLEKSKDLVQNKS